MTSPLDRARELAARFRSDFKTIVLGTSSPEAEPDASPVAAALDDDGAFLIYVSGLTTHTRHLAANPRASVLLLEDETVTIHAFARRRLTFACAATLVPRTDDASFQRGLSLLRGKFGSALAPIAPLPDFQLFRLAPLRGRLVAGFGEAYEVDPRDWSRLTHVGRPAAPTPR